MLWARFIIFFQKFILAHNSMIWNFYTENPPTGTKIRLKIMISLEITWCNYSIQQVVWEIKFIHSEGYKPQFFFETKIKSQFFLTISFHHTLSWNSHIEIMNFFEESSLKLLIIFKNISKISDPLSHRISLLE